MDQDFEVRVLFNKIDSSGNGIITIGDLLQCIYTSILLFCYFNMIYCNINLIAVHSFSLIDNLS